MAFIPKNTKKKVETGYKTIYISKDLEEKINEIAAQNDTSFNNVVVSMIERCLDEE